MRPRVLRASWPIPSGGSQVYDDILNDNGLKWEHMTMSRKLQVFVSSTYLDMKEERQAAVQAILEAGHIPAGMELFAAGDEEQLAVIYHWIDECDVLLLLLGERYGSIEPKSGKSYVQLEYEYAVDRGKRFFALVLDDAWIQNKYKELGANASDESRKEHQLFKEQVLRRISALVADKKDVRLEVYKSLREFDRDDSMAGWVRASEASDQRKLVHELQTTLEELRSRTGEASVPSLSELHRTFSRHTADLRSKLIDFRFRFTYSDVGEERCYRAKGTALGYVWFFHDQLTDRNGMFRQAEYPVRRQFEDRVFPLLEIWGLIQSRRNPAYLSPVGVLFMQYLSDNQLGVDQFSIDEEPRPELNTETSQS